MFSQVGWQQLVIISGHAPHTDKPSSFLGPFVLHNIGGKSFMILAVSHIVLIRATAYIVPFCWIQQWFELPV